MNTYAKLLLSLILLLSINIIVLNSSYFNEQRIVKSDVIQQFLNEKLLCVDNLEINKEAIKQKINDFYDNGLEPEVKKMNDIKEAILIVNLLSILLLLFVWALQYMYLRFKQNQILLISRIVLMTSIVWLLITFVNNNNLINSSSDLKRLIIIGVIPFILVNFSLWILKKNLQEKKELE